MPQESSLEEVLRKRDTARRVLEQYTGHYGISSQAVQGDLLCVDTVDVTTALEKQAVDAEGPVLALFAASGRGSPFAAPAEQFARVSVRSFSLPGHMRGATLESEPQHTASIDEDVARESLSEVGRVGSLEAGHPLRIEHHYEKHALAGSATTEADASSNIVGYGNEGSASGTGSPFYSPRTSRATSPLRRVHSITLCTNGREADVKLLTHPSQALTQEEFADRGLDKELIDREKFRASSYAVEPVWDPTTNVTKRCAKPDIFRVDDGERLRREAAAATLAEQHQAQERARSAALRSQLSFTRRQSEPTGTQYDAFGVLIKPSPTIKPRYLDWLPSARAARAVAEAEASRPTPAPPHTFSPYSGIDPKPRGPVAWLLNAAPSAGVSTPAVLINPQNAVPRHASRPQSAKPLWRPSSAHAASPSSQKSVHGNRRPMSAMQGAGGSSSSNSGRQEVAVTGWQQQQQQRQQEVAAPGQRPSSAHLADMKSYTVTQIAMPCQVTTASQLGGMNASLTAGLPAPRFASSAHGAAHSNGAHQSNRAGLAQGQHYLSKGLVPPTETTGAQPAHGNTEQFTTHDRMTHRMADPVQAASPPSRPEGVTDAHYAQIARQQQKWLRESVAVPAVTWAAPAGLSAYGPRKRPQSALPAGSSSSVHHTTLTTTIHTSTTSGNDASSGNGLNRIMPHGRPLSAPSEGPSTNSSTTAGGHNSSSGANRMGTARPVSAMASTGRTSTGKGTYLTHTSSSGARAGTAAAGSVPWGAGSRPNSAAVKPPSRPVSACATSAWHHGTDSDGLHVASQHAAAIEVEMLQVPMQQLRSLTEEERNALLVSEQAGKGGGRKQVLAADSNALYQQMVSAYMMA